MPFKNLQGLLALASLIPFIILYLQRPKPREQLIPSLMFVLQDKKRSKQYSFLRKLLNNLLFLLQLLVLLGISFTVAAPYVKIPYDVTLENTVIVIDASASMQAVENGISRFDRAVSAAKGLVSGKNSIILAESTPLIVLEDESSDTALDVLRKIKPKATTTNLGDAMLLAKDILGERPGRISVLSDFDVTEGPDIDAVEHAIESTGEGIERVVDLIDVSNNAANMGIVKLEILKRTGKAHIRNFNSNEANVEVKLKKDNNLVASSAIKVLPNSVEIFEFDIPSGATTIEITRDSFAPDDVIYISSPEKSKNKVVLVTNSKNSNLESALESSQDIELKVVNPPVITVTKNGERVEPYKSDAIVFYAVERKELLPGTMEDIASYVKKGGNLVIAAQPDIASIDFGELEVIGAKMMKDAQSKACIETENQLTKIFGRERCFAAVYRYIESEPAKSALVMASTEGSPALAMKELKKGKAFYYGILDDASDFKTLPSYPIFWNSLINYLAALEDVRDFNYNTGKIISVKEQKVKTPSSTITATKLMLDEVGIYEFDGRKVAVNLLNEKESDIKPKAAKEEKGGSAIKGEKKERDLRLDEALLVAAFLVMLLELLYIKARGDL